MEPRHDFQLVEQLDGWTYLQCPECSKAIRIRLDGDGLEVLKPGDFYARHSWAQHMTLTVDVTSEAQ